MNDAQRRPSAVRRAIRTAINVEEELGPGIVSSGVQLLFLGIFVPVGLVAFIGTMAVVALIGTALGLTTGAGATITGVGAFLAAGLITFLLFRVMYRRLPRRVRNAPADPAALLGFEADEGPTSGDGGAVGRSPAEAQVPPPQPSLAELDARLAPPADQAGGERLRSSSSTASSATIRPVGTKP